MNLNDSKLNLSDSKPNTITNTLNSIPSNNISSATKLNTTKKNGQTFQMNN